MKRRLIIVVLIGLALACVGAYSRGLLVPAADSAANQTVMDVVGNKTDAAADTADVVSLMGVLRYTLAEAVEIETHLHSGERWFGTAAAPAGETHIADRVGAGAQAAEAAPLVVDAGNDDWGTWTQILGSTDTPVDSGSTSYYDMHRLHLIAAEDTAQRYIVQIALQEDAPADDPGASDTYTEFCFTSAGVGATEHIPPLEFQGPRVATTTKAWMRTRAENQNTSTIDFYIGLHEYD